MQPALISLLTLMVALAVGIGAKVNIGLVSLAAGFLVGRFALGLSPVEIVAGWPMRLFFVLFAMSMLFGVLSSNGTLHLVIKRTVLLVRGRRRLLPLMLLLASTVLSGLGAGNIAVTAIMMPPALALAREEGLSMVLVSAMVILGSCAGGLSPIAPTGIIANDLAQSEGMEIAWPLFRDMLIGILCFSIATYFVMGGWRIPHSTTHGQTQPPAFHRSQRVTLLVTSGVILAIMFGSDIALTAFFGTALLLLLRTARETDVIARVPWSAILLVCGVATLISIVERMQGIELMTTLLGRIMTESTVGPVLSTLAGLMSQVSSASGVVLPTLIPTARGISEQLGGSVRPEALISVISLGSHLVVTSPFSTLGALAIASAGDDRYKDALFRHLILLAFASLAAGAAMGYILLRFYRLVG